MGGVNISRSVCNVRKGCFEVGEGKKVEKRKGQEKKKPTSESKHEIR